MCFLTNSLSTRQRIKKPEIQTNESNLTFGSSICSTKVGALCKVETGPWQGNLWDASWRQKKRNKFWYKTVSAPSLELYILHNCKHLLTTWLTLACRPSFLVLLAKIELWTVIFVCPSPVTFELLEWSSRFELSIARTYRLFLKHVPL
jgi:hypothetical protein